MTAVSSFRPIADCERVARNQIRASKSWRPIFSEIIYFGSPEPLMAAPAVQFIPCDPFPPISALALAASMGGNWAAIINADIVITPALLAAIPQAISRFHARAIVSRRWEFDPDKPNFDEAKVVDEGLDFFLAERSLWLAFSRQVPVAYRIGHPAWDTYLLGWLNVICGRQCVDITSKRCVFHPKHGDRHQPYRFEVVEDHFGQSAGHPVSRL